MSGAQTNNAFDDNMDFITKFDPAMAYGAIASASDMIQNQMSLNSMNPCLTIRDWSTEEDYQQYLNPSLMSSDAVW